MSALLTILRILGWALLALLGLAALLCVTPVSVRLLLEDGELTVYARVWGVRINIIPGLASKKKAEKDAGADADAAPKKPQKAEKRADLSTVLQYLSAGAKAAKWFLAHIRVRGVVIALAPDAGDPMHTGFAAGRAWAEIGALTALAQNTFRSVAVESVSVTPVFFEAYAPREKFCCKLSALAGIMVGTLVVFLKRRAALSAPAPEEAKEN